MRTRIWNLCAKRPLAAAVALACAAWMTGCYTGPDPDNNPWTAGEGVVQKGPLQRGSWINVSELSSTTFQPNGKSFNFKVLDDYGRFNPSGTVFTSSYIEATALGYYFDELTGKLSDDVVLLRGFGKVGDPAINVNLLTALISDRQRVLMTRSSNRLTFENARIQAQNNLLGSLGFFRRSDVLPGGAGASLFGELDIGRDRDADAFLTVISAAITKAGGTGAGITQFVSEMSTDLADDGQVNGSTGSPALLQRFQLAAAQVDWELVSFNLFQKYRRNDDGGRAFKQWVDSSCTGTPGTANFTCDGLIDRYKTAGAQASDMVAEYTVLADEAGYCYRADVVGSVSFRLKGGATLSQAAVTSAAGLPIAAGQTVVATVSGSERSGFKLFRKPASGGNCPADVAGRPVRMAINAVPGGYAQPMSPNATVEIEAVNAGTWAVTGVKTRGRVEAQRGNFDAGPPPSADYFQVTATGVPTKLFPNEPLDGAITLRAWGRRGGGMANVNVLTTLAFERQRRLMTVDRLDFVAAANRARDELLAALGILAPYTEDFPRPAGTARTGNETLSSLEYGASGRMTALPSAIWTTMVSAGGGNAAGVIRFMADFSADFADDGRVNGSAGTAGLADKFALARLDVGGMHGYGISGWKDWFQLDKGLGFGDGFELTDQSCQLSSAGQVSCVDGLLDRYKERLRGSYVSIGLSNTPSWPWLKGYCVRIEFPNAAWSVSSSPSGAVSAYTGPSGVLFDTEGRVEIWANVAYGQPGFGAAAKLFHRPPVNGNCASATAPWELTWLLRQEP